MGFLENYTLWTICFSFILDTVLCTSLQTSSTFPFASVNITYFAGVPFSCIWKNDIKTTKGLKKWNCLDDRFKYELNSYKRDISCHIQWQQLQFFFWLVLFNLTIFWVCDKRSLFSKTEIMLTLERFPFAWYDTAIFSK